MDMTPTIHSPNQAERPQDDEFPFNESAPVNNLESETSSDEEDIIEGNGYQLLPQGEENDEQGTADDFSSDREEEDEVMPENPFIHTLFLETLNAPSNAETSDVEEKADCSPLDQDKIEEIKSVMAGFTLPRSAIPDWAQRIPEEDWFAELTSRIQRRAEVKANSGKEK